MNVLLRSVFLVLLHVAQLSQGKSGGEIMMGMIMKLGDFEKDLKFLENVEISSNACTGGCEEDCDEDCDFFGSSCDEDCDEACNTNCGDAEGEEDWYDTSVDDSDALTENVEDSSDNGVLAYDCYDTYVLTDQFNEKFESLNGYTHPHMQHKYEVLEKLKKMGLTYDYHRRVRLNKLSNEKKEELNILDWFSDENMNNINYMNSKIDDSAIYGDNMGIINEATCTSYYTAFYDDLTSSFSVVSSVLDSPFETGLTFMVGYSVDYVLWTESVSIGIAMSSDDIGIFFSLSSGIVLLSVGESFFGGIGFEWSYDDIPGESYEVGISADIPGTSASVGVSYGFSSDTYDWTGISLTFEFGVGVSILPICISIEGVDTELYSIYNDVSMMMNNMNDNDNDEKDETSSSKLNDKNSVGYFGISPENVTYIHIIGAFIILLVVYSVGYFIFKAFSLIDNNEKYRLIL